MSIIWSFLQKTVISSRGTSRWRGYIKTNDIAPFTETNLKLRESPSNNIVDPGDSPLLEDLLSPVSSLVSNCTVDAEGPNSSVNTFNGSLTIGTDSSNRIPLEASNLLVT